jgi:serine/threonine protein kinase
MVVDTPSKYLEKDVETRTKWVCLKCCAEHFEEKKVCDEDGETLRRVLLDALVGTVFAERYELVSLLGRGGMSSVYKARHLLLDKIFAVKLMHAHLMTDMQSVRRFQIEAKAASSLSHPNLIMVHDFGVSKAGTPYLVMDFIEGKSLTEVLDEEKHLSVDRSLSIVQQVFAGLAHAHQQNVLHRDLKPSNIMIVQLPDGTQQARIVDFGIAKILGDDNGAASQLTQSGEVFGSPAYMSPEQCMGKTLDAKSDLYSMGCVVYQCLSSEPPFLGATPLDTFSRQCKESPKPIAEVCPEAKVPALVEDVILKALEKDPQKRHESAEEFSKCLTDAYEKSKEQEALQYLAARMQLRFRRFRQNILRNIVKISIASVALIAIGAALLYFDPNVREAAHNTLRPSIISNCWSAGKFFAKRDNPLRNYSVAEFLLTRAVHEADDLRPQPDTNTRIDSRDDLQKLYNEYGYHAEADRVDHEIKNIKANFLKFRYGVIRQEENSLALKVLMDLDIPADQARAKDMALALGERSELSLKTGAYPLAAAEAQTAFRIWTNNLRQQDRAALKCLDVLSRTYEQMADDSQSDAAKLQTKSQPNQAKSLSVITENHFADATKQSEKLLAMATSSSPPDYEYIARAQLNLARLSLTREQYSESEQWFKKAIDSAAHWMTINSADQEEPPALMKEVLSQYVASLRRMKRMDEAAKVEQRINDLERDHPSEKETQRTFR